MVRAMFGVQLKDRKRSIDFMFMLGLNETIDQLAIVSCVVWYGHVLRREDGHVLRRALDIEVVVLVVELPRLRMISKALELRLEGP